MLFIGKVQIWTPSIWGVKGNSPSIERFGVSMAMSFVCPLGKWASTSMSFNGGETSPPHQANKAFTHGYALEHIVIPIQLLPSYW